MCDLMMVGTRRATPPHYPPYMLPTPAGPHTSYMGVQFPAPVLPHGPIAAVDAAAKLRGVCWSRMCTRICASDSYRFRFCMSFRGLTERAAAVLLATAVVYPHWR